MKCNNTICKCTYMKNALKGIYMYSIYSEFLYGIVCCGRVLTVIKVCKVTGL